MIISKIMNKNPKYFDINVNLDDVIEYFLTNKKNSVIITREDVVVGIIESKSIIKNCYVAEKKTRLIDLIKDDIIILNINNQVSEVININQGIIPIVNEESKLVGEVTNVEILDYLKNKLINFKEQYAIQKAIFNNSYDGLYITDGNGYTLDVNKSYIKITGLKKEDLIGYHMADLIKKGFFLESVSLKVLELKKPLTMIDSFENGKRCLITGTPIFNDNNEIIRVVTNVRDMTELTELQSKVEQSEELNKKYEQEIQYLRSENMKKSKIVGQSQSFRTLMELVYRIAESDATVLITGETGTGKEVIAKEIHKRSFRKEEPFIKVNCAAIPGTLLESELFGYEKGAFTGAVKTKPGKFELANRGTILLDEIGEMPLELQSKLLRVIQEREITRLGGIHITNLDIRIIASTNRNIEKLIEIGKFRKDLYYRLNVVPIEIPALRERREDVILFADYFLKIFNKKYNHNKILDNEAFKLLLSYEWPGNIREIENLIERLVVTSNKTIIDGKYLLTFMGEKDYINFEGNLNEKLKEIEKQILENAVKKYRTTRKVAKILGVSQPTIVRKMNKYGIRAIN